MDETTTRTKPGRDASGFLRLWPLALLLAGLLAAYWLGAGRFFSLQWFLDSREYLLSVVHGHPFKAAASFCLLYAVLVAVAFPAASIMTIAGGFLFGWLLGGALVVVGATLGATALFIAARHAFGDILRRRAGSAVASFADGFSKDAFSYLLVLRLTPVLPFFALNIAPAFLKVDLRTFVATTFLGIIPGSLVYAFLGSGIDQSLKRLGDGAPSITDLATPQTTIALFGLAALAVLGLILKKTVLRRRKTPVGRPPDQRPATVKSHH